jgi:hypothetical protein
LQLRIRVECCFGILVNKWAILRASMPQNFTVAKTTAVVNALAKLHNFCIDQRDAAFAESLDEPLILQDLGALMNADGGMIDMTPVLDYQGTRLFSTPRSLMQSGNHFNEIEGNPRANEDGGPRLLLHNKVVDSGKVRPSLKGTTMPIRKNRRK